VVYDETEAIPVQRGAASRSGTGDRTETIAVDETEAIPAQDRAQTGGSIDDTQTIAVDQTMERPSVEEPAGADEPADDDTAEDVVVAEAPGAEPVAPAVDEPAGDEAVVAEEGLVPPPDADHDRLQRIRGVGPAMERLLNEQGIVTFRQLAVLDDAGIEQLQSRLPGFSGRIRRDRWIEQARELHLETHGDQP
jgi:predicted flap endonuclease-1-like 5' DNA nuclease